MTSLIPVSAFFASPLMPSPEKDGARLTGDGFLAAFNGPDLPGPMDTPDNPMAGDTADQKGMSPKPDETAGQEPPTDEPAQEPPTDEPEVAWVDAKVMPPEIHIPPKPKGHSAAPLPGNRESPMDVPDRETPLGPSPRGADLRLSPAQDDGGAAMAVSQPLATRERPAADIRGADGLELLAGGQDWRSSDSRTPIRHVVSDLLAAAIPRAMSAQSVAPAVIAPLAVHLAAQPDTTRGAIPPLQREQAPAAPQIGVDPSAFSKGRNLVAPLHDPAKPGLPSVLPVALDILATAQPSGHPMASVQTAWPPMAKAPRATVIPVTQATGPEPPAKAGGADRAAVADKVSPPAGRASPAPSVDLPAQPPAAARADIAVMAQTVVQAAMQAAPDKTPRAPGPLPMPDHAPKATRAAPPVPQAPQAVVVQSSPAPFDPASLPVSETHQGAQHTPLTLFDSGADRGHVGTTTLPADPASRLQPAAMVQSIARQVADAAPRAAEAAIEITLHPEELGRLKLTLTGSEGAQLLQVVAERPETLDLVRRHIDLLMREFGAQGFGGLNVSLGSNRDAPARFSAPRQDTQGAEQHLSTQAETPATQSPGLLRDGLDLRL